MKNIGSILLTATLIFGSCFAGTTFAQQNNGGADPVKLTADGYTILPEGVEYKIIKDVPGKNAKMGEFIYINVVMKADTMTVQSSWRNNNGKPVSIPLNESKQKSDWLTALPHLSKGDSAVIRVSMDTILAANVGKSLPPFIKEGGYMIFEVKVTDIMTAEENTKEMNKRTEEQKALAKKQVEKDDKMLKDYITKHKIKAQKTASGLYYSIKKQGTGNLIKNGQRATLNYTGTLLDGKMFDSNVDSSKHHVQPFPFVVGKGSVIPGWDEGVKLLKKGTKATFYIPSALAYGSRAMGADIPANSNLIFDVEVLDVEDVK